MNIAEFAIQKKTVTLVLCVLICVGGILAYENLGRLEDPEFTIKTAVVITAYPGATPREVAEEVTDEIETAIQQLPQLDRVESISKAGLSIIKVEIKDRYNRQTLPQVWDELRRKVVDVQSKLPPGVLTPSVIDDFGDVYGILLAITGQGFSYEELKEYVKLLRRELLLVDNVSKIELWGLQQEALFVEISRSRMAQLGVGLDVIYATLREQNSVTPAGSVKVGPEYIRISPTGAFDSLEDIANLNIYDPSSKRFIFLRDVATISRDYVTPSDQILRYNNNQALSLGISIVQGGNVVKLGQAVKKRLAELQAQTPVGIELGVINFQSEDVSRSVNGFIINFLEAIGIVILVLLLTMGLQSGLIIGATLAMTVLGTFVFMDILDINLQRATLGALVIALGMLVDNAIVVTEGILSRVKKGSDRFQAAIDAVGQSMLPLLGATVITVLAFAAIGISKDATGEYLISLFQVMLISLMLSWVIAITVTPLFCTLFLKKTPSRDDARDPYGGIVFLIYKKFLVRCLRFRWLTMIVMLGLLGAAFFGFSRLKEGFFPESTRPQFQLHYWLPAGTDIRQTSEDFSRIEKFLLTDKRVLSTASYIGSGATRYMLTFMPEISMDKGYGLLLISVKDYQDIDDLMQELMQHLTENFPDAQPIVKKFSLGPGGGGVEVRFSGPDPNVLRKLSNQAQAIMGKNPDAYAIKDNWRQRVKVIRPQYDETRARQVGVSRPVLSRALEMAFSGTLVGVYREGDEILPVITRLPEAERQDVKNINDLQIWSPVTLKPVSVHQVVSSFQSDWEDSMIHRRNRKSTITVSCEPKFGVLASKVFETVRADIEKIPLPSGYDMEWGGEYESSVEARGKLMASLPVTLLIMILIVIMLFNNLKQPLIIWLTVPLAIIGVALGLLVFDLSFDFMALLGVISLVGMLVKNCIVLIDQINLENRIGKSPFAAIIDSSVSRLRPVSMAAITTVLGMAPLLQDIFFRSMAVTIMSGLAFATLLTLIVLPVFYVIFFRVSSET